MLGMLIESDFQGELYLVNPKHEAIRGLPCYPSVSAIGKALDLVVIAVPAEFTAIEENVGAVLSTRIVASIAEDKLSKLSAA